MHNKGVGWEEDKLYNTRENNATREHGGGAGPHFAARLGAQEPVEEVSQIFHRAFTLLRQPGPLYVPNNDGDDDDDDDDDSAFHALHDGLTQSVLRVARFALSRTRGVDDSAILMAWQPIGGSLLAGRARDQARTTVMVDWMAPFAALFWMVTLLSLLPSERARRSNLLSSSRSDGAAEPEADPMVMSVDHADVWSTHRGPRTTGGRGHGQDGLKRCKHCDRTGKDAFDGREWRVRVGDFRQCQVCKRAQGGAVDSYIRSLEETLRERPLLVYQGPTTADDPWVRSGLALGPGFRALRALVLRLSDQVYPDWQIEASDGRLDWPWSEESAGRHLDFWKVCQSRLVWGHPDVERAMLQCKASLQRVASLRRSPPDTLRVAWAGRIRATRAMLDRVHARRLPDCEFAEEHAYRQAEMDILLGVRNIKITSSGDVKKHVQIVTIDECCQKLAQLVQGCEAECGTRRLIVHNEPSAPKQRAHPKCARNKDGTPNSGLTSPGHFFFVVATLQKHTYGKDAAHHADATAFSLAEGGSAPWFPFDLTVPDGPGALGGGFVCVPSGFQLAVAIMDTMHDYGMSRGLADALRHLVPDPSQRVLVARAAPPERAFSQIGWECGALAVLANDAVASFPSVSRMVRGGEEEIWAAVVNKIGKDENARRAKLRSMDKFVKDEGAVVR